MLLKVANDIANQTVKPVVWIILDDGSCDQTWQIIEELEKRFYWIKGIRIKPSQQSTYANERYARIIRFGFKHAVSICHKHSFNYDFLAVIDADIRLEKDYFEKLFTAFKSDQRLGVASGFVYEPGMSRRELNDSNVTPRGCALVFRKKCYEMIGGFQGHTNSIVKAERRNWRISTIKSVRVFHQRVTGSGKGYFFTAGKSAYFYNYHPVNAFLTGVYLIMKASPTKGLSYLMGYIGSYIMRDEKSQDEEIKQYFWMRINRLLIRPSKNLRKRHPNC
jgi:glycosyltransferase involved in cell wall biosynthesis